MGHRSVNPEEITKLSKAAPKQRGNLVNRRFCYTIIGTEIVPAVAFSLKIAVEVVRLRRISMAIFGRMKDEG